MGSKFFVVVWIVNGVSSSKIVEALSAEEVKRWFEFHELQFCGNGAFIADIFEWFDSDSEDWVD